MPFLRYLLRGWLLPATVIAGAIVAARLGGHFAYETALRKQAAEAEASLAPLAEALDRYIDRYRIMPAVLALDPQLRATLENADDGELRRRANERLLQLNFSNRTSTLTLLDRDGMAIAASNWKAAESNVGHFYDYRPYFKDALAKGNGEFYAIGATTGVAGDFIARAVRDDAGNAIGVVAVKVELGGIQAEWEKAGRNLLLSDANGVVFLASRPDWRYRALAPLTAAQTADLNRTRQYGDHALANADAHTLLDLPTGARLVDIRSPQEASEMLWQSHLLTSEGWTLHLLEDTRASRHAGWIATVVSAGAWLLLVSIAIVVWQRHRIVSLKMRGERELKRLVEHHTAALHSAQDSVLQAAREAALGQGHSLDHLPQGVSVIDRDLNLVAWNQRYAELFRYPPDFLEAGRPIADLIRYNAKRGFLGADAGEDAIQRRLARLRSGRPHLHERTSPDGTVIEIRGNPLPDGGFVTSYVDITAYKQAARDLRSLVESLEAAIRQRTSELQIAKSAAEQASRSKTRLVAAAVHDLLQPLNAARLYLHALRKGTDKGDGELIGHINDALSTQEDILSSLLDISRLESGTFEVRTTEFSLGSLFDSLKAQFAPIAAARGIELRVVGTRAVIRSDDVLVRRVIQNFLSNALNFARRDGSVLVGCRRQSQHLRIEVWDTGPGIPENKRETIFEEFQRLDGGVRGADNGAAHGAGLGLAIVRHIARVLDHRVALRSWPGRGSVFSIEVPRGTACNPAAAAVDDEDETLFRHRSFWIVDDDPHSARAAQALLLAWGCEVRLLRSAAEAVSAGAQAPRPELLLLDYRLGETTGFALGASLRAAWGDLPPVILVSADAYSDLRARCQELGWGFLPKPLRPGALRALMMRIFERSAARTSADSTAT